MSRDEYVVALACGCMTDEELLRGFAEHYLCAGLGSRDACRDVCLKASAKAAAEAGEQLLRAFRHLAGEEEGCRRKTKQKGEWKC